MTRILLTGGFGFIGSHTVVALHEAGFDDVVVVDDLRRSSPVLVDGVAAIVGGRIRHESIDVADPVALSGVFADQGPFDVVVHFAGYKSVRESVEHPLRYYRNNVGSTLTLLETMADFECRKLVFSSSCTVYGQADRLPVDEFAPERPAASPYGHTKQVCEQMISSSPDLTHALSLRYFNPAGAHESAKIGELPFGVPENLVPFITQTAAGWRDRLQIFGSDYATPDGTAVRDYLHVVDLAEAHAAAVRTLLSGEAMRTVVNLGSGRGHSVLAALAAFRAATGVEVPYDFAARRPGDVEQIWSSSERAAALLGWRVRYSLEDILSSAWAWQKTLQMP